MKRLQYSVKGMSCAACVGHVERAVSSAVGEEDEVTVSLLTNGVTVLLREEIGEEEAPALELRISAAVKRAGYALLTDATPRRESQSEAKQARLRLILSALFTLAVMYLAMGGMVGLPIPHFLVGAENALTMVLAQLLLTLPVLILNFKFFRNGFSALLHRAPNMDSLIAVGSGASVLYGLFALLMILINDDPALIHSYLHDLYFESAAMILTLVSLGKLLEERARNRASDAVRSLANLTPKLATVLRDGKERTIAAEEIVVGDEVLIRAGEWIPIDGTVIAGSGSTDESALTGESMPVEKEIGSSVRAACILTDGVLTVRAEQVGEGTSLSRIIRLLEDTAASKAPIARIADRVSAVFVPCVMAISALTLILWMIFSHNAEQSLRSAIAVLVISCPCALGLATPTAITVGIGRGAGSGILFRSAEALEKLCGVRTVLFDKTGTVTEGRPSVTDLISYGIDPQELLSYAAAVERLSSHPLAQAVTRCAEERRVSIPSADQFVNRVGIGAEAIVNEKLCRIGKPDPAYLSSEDTGPVESDADRIDEDASEDGVRILRRDGLSRIGDDLEALEERGRTAVEVTLDGVPVGIIGLSDRIRSDSAAAVEALKNAGVTCLMLTGDHERTAAFVARETNLDGFRANLMPEDKERLVREYSERGTCAMVGDGINDAPALVRADVGIAIGAGTDVAIDCAGVVLSRSSLCGVTEAILLSRATIRIIKQNLFWALFYNAICIPVAAGLFYPLFHWQLSPMLASAAMSCSSVFVVLNALRLKRVRLMPAAASPKNTLQKTNQQEGEQSEMLFQKASKTYRMTVEGMMCPRCVAHVKSALEAVKGVKEVIVSLEEKSATVTASADASVLSAAVTEAGYEVKEILEVGK